MTKRNYQIIQMAERQMNKEHGVQNQDLPPEMVQQMMENEQNEINAAIQQSLKDEDEKRRIAAIEEEEMRRAIKESLEQKKKMKKSRRKKMKMKK